MRWNDRNVGCNWWSDAELDAKKQGEKKFWGREDEKRHHVSTHKWNFSSYSEGVASAM